MPPPGDPPDFPKHPLWDFVLDVYHRKGVEHALLALQNRHNINVNMVLYLIWVGVEGRGTMPQAEINRAIKAVDEWHRQITQAVRQVHQRLREELGQETDPIRTPVRRSVAATEIDAEHAELLILGRLAPDGDKEIPREKRLQDVVRNIGNYLMALDIMADPYDRRHFVAILSAVFNEVTHVALERAVRTLPTKGIR